MPVYGLHQVDLAPMLIHMDVMYADNAGAVIGLRGSPVSFKVPTQSVGTSVERLSELDCIASLSFAMTSLINDGVFSV
jgi:hypothetical protein